ncbi:FAD-dependent oxidoreductase [Dactylosporangium salmoneum]|uniref:FAD dependent oxidoreductase domain-containing protein n=1 Tax=Dactylosporangium salmoneum TaxID=53361 RepID=A0ABP5T103_9ACTN
MRVGILGAGIAGTTLAWRLAGAGVRVELATGPPGLAGATAVSGGAVRSYDPDPVQRALATQSLAELRGSPSLLEWSRFRPMPTVLVGEPGPLGADDLRKLGWAGLAPDTTGVRDDTGGRIDVAALRDALLRDLAGCAAATIGQRLSGEPDVLVYAAGAWTPALLAKAGLSTLDLKVKAIRYTVHRLLGPPPPIFSDGPLYGIPLGDGRLIAGVATDEWGVAPGAPPARPPADAARLLRDRLPGLRLGPPLGRADATDCYADPPVLALREIPGTGGRIHAFTGGSGGAAKTVLAAAARAADQLNHHTQEEARATH